MTDWKAVSFVLARGTLRRTIPLISPGFTRNWDSSGSFSSVTAMTVIPEFSITNRTASSPSVS